MPLISDKEIEERLNSPDNLVNRLHVHKIERRQEGTTHIPIEIKKVAAILGTEGESCRDVERGLGISRNAVNLAERGIDNTQYVPELKRVIDETKTKLNQNRETAESLAVDALLSSLNLFKDDPSLVKSKSGKTASSVAKDMAAIANMMGNGRDPDGKGERAMHLHLYAPAQKKLKDYDVIDVTS